MLRNRILWETISLRKIHERPGLVISYLCVRQNHGLHQRIQHRKPHLHLVSDIFKPMTVTPEVSRKFPRAMGLHADIALINPAEKELSGTTFWTRHEVLVNGVQFRHITTQRISAAILLHLLHRSKTLFHSGDEIIESCNDKIHSTIARKIPDRNRSRKQRTTVI